MAKSKSKQFRRQANQLSRSLALQVESARDKAGPVIADARDKAAPVIADARDKAAPVIADARDKAAPAIDTAKDRFNSDVRPKIAAAVVAAGEATEDVRGEAKKRGRATAAALKGEVDPPKQTHRLRRFLVFTGLTAIGALVAKALSDRKSSTAWQSSYEPSPASSDAAQSTGTSADSAPVSPATTALSDPTPAATSAAAASGIAGDDEGAAGPDEAAADAADVPHPATTPDEPAEEIKVNKDS